MTYTISIFRTFSCHSFKKKAAFEMPNTMLALDLKKLKLKLFKLSGRAGSLLSKCLSNVLLCTLRTYASRMYLLNA